MLWREMGFQDMHLELAIEIQSVGEARLSHFPYGSSDTEGMKDGELRFEA